MTIAWFRDYFTVFKAGIFGIFRAEYSSLVSTPLAHSGDEEDSEDSVIVSRGGGSGGGRGARGSAPSVWGGAGSDGAARKRPLLRHLSF